MEKSTLKSHKDPMHFNKKNRAVKCTLDYIYTNKMQKVSLFIFILLGAPRNVESICNKRFTKFNLLTECIHTVSRYFHSNSFIRISSLALLYLAFAFAPAELWTWENLLWKVTIVEITISPLHDMAKSNKKTFPSQVVCGGSKSR